MAKTDKVTIFHWTVMVIVETVMWTLYSPNVFLIIAVETCHLLLPRASFVFVIAIM